MTKDIIIGGLVILLIINTIFVICCMKTISEVENDNQPSNNRKTKTDK